MGFNELYFRIRSHYLDYNAQYPLSYVRTGDIQPYNPSRDTSDIMIMMGASANHVVTLLSCMLSFVRVFTNSSILIIDYGMAETDLCWLNHLFGLIHQFHLMKNVTAQLYYRKYNWGVFPDWMNINDTVLRGGYTWKPIAIADAFYQWKGVIMWSDAGNYYHADIPKAIDILRREGAYIPYDHAQYSKKMSIKCYEFLLIHRLIQPIDRESGMGGAGFMLFDYGSSICRHQLMIPWLHCAYTRKCMAPIGSRIAFHLPEQSVIAILATQNGFVSSCNEKMRFTAQYWTDRNIHTLNNNTYLVKEMQYLSVALGKTLTVDQEFGICHE